MRDRFQRCFFPDKFNRQQISQLYTADTAFLCVRLAAFVDRLNISPCGAVSVPCRRA